MTSMDLLRGFFAFLYAASLAWAVYSRDDPEFQLGEDEIKMTRRRYSPIIAPMLLNFFVLLFLVFWAVIGWDRAVSEVLGLFVNIFLSIFVYYILLLAVLPLLRRWFSARACALLWLLPNYLYIIGYSFMSPDAPKLILRLEGDGVLVVLAVWFAGFAAVLLWKVIAHLIFRRKLLKGAQYILNPDVARLWEEVQRDAAVKKPKYRPMVSPNAAAPLSIGLFPWSIRVVLPEREYMPDELRLIFRHELAHILRSDNWAKFFMTTCTAACWFNPLMWLAMRRSAEDLELSCDELVLSGAGGAERRAYAELILSAAGDGRGFTTCLSATADALRYRLKNIVRPRKRLVGGITAGVIFFALLMTCGYVALAWGGDSAENLIFHGARPEISTCSFGERDPRHWNYFRNVADAEALTDYLAGLELYRMTGNYNLADEGGMAMTVIYRAAGVYGVDLRDHFLTFTPLHGGSPRQLHYYISREMDWEYLESLLA